MDEKELRPVRDRKVLIILMVIFVVIAVSVLYVYQAGDRKTVLGNQPIPAGQVNVGPAPVAFHVPVVGVPSSPATGGGAESQSTVNCPVCSTKGLPICSSCGSIMQPIGQGGAGGLFACPRCGAAGLPICPRCGGHMACPDNLKVSVVIATYRREEVVCETVRQVLAEPFENKEVLVIDQTEEHTVARLQDVVERCYNEPQDFCALESGLIGADHQAFGGALAAKWRFPPALRYAIACHHDPNTVPPEHRKCASVVHVADILCCQAQYGFWLTGRTEEIDESALGEVGLSPDILAQIAEALPEGVMEAEQIFA